VDTGEAIVTEPWRTVAIGWLFVVLTLSGAWLGAAVGGTVVAALGAGAGFFFALMAAFLWR
jgi:hypothetical protein